MSGAKLYGQTNTHRIKRLLEQGKTRIAVYGLGPTGLAMSVITASCTKNVIGVEPDTAMADRIAKGHCIDRVDPTLNKYVRKAVGAGVLKISTNTENVATHADVHIITAPTGVYQDGTPDLSPLRTILRDIGNGLTTGDTVLLASMVPPKTTIDLVCPILMEESGLDVDTFGVGVCALSPKRTLKAIRNEPAVISGMDDESVRVVKTVLESLTMSSVIDGSDPTVVETVGVTELAYLELLDTLTTELAIYSEELGAGMADVCELLAKRTHGSIPVPEVAIPTDRALHFLLDTTASKPQPLRAAVNTNDGLPSQLAEITLTELRESGKKPTESIALILGLPFDRDISSPEEAHVFRLARTLVGNGVGVFAADPSVEPPESFRDYKISLAAVGDAKPDVILYLSDNPAFERIDWGVFDDPVIIDLRGKLSAESIDHRVRSIGRKP